MGLFRDFWFSVLVSYDFPCIIRVEILPGINLLFHLSKLRRQRPFQDHLVLRGPKVPGVLAYVIFHAFSGVFE